MITANAQPSKDAGLEVAEEGWQEPSLPDTRRGARQLALQALYWERACAGTVDEALATLGSRHNLSTANAQFAAKLAATVCSQISRIDALINSSASHWRTDRIARLDLILLRLGLAEILFFDEIPISVSIDEAVSLAKEYCGEQAYAFVNGVLDAVAKNPSALEDSAVGEIMAANQESPDPPAG